MGPARLLSSREFKMVWVVVEVLLAFAIAVFIVWWTFPKDTADPPSGDAESGPGRRDADQ